MNHRAPTIVCTLSALLAWTPCAWAGGAVNTEQAPRTMPIDDSLFVASGSGLRSITVERRMDAGPEAVWAAWTDAQAWKAVYGPDRPELEAHIELAVGGRYEWLFDGEIGSNECQVLSYLPPRMLSFSWNAPTTQPLSRAKRTWMVIEIEAGPEGGSLVRATQLGFGEGAHWDETLDYFQSAWAQVLDRMAGHFADR